ncbi:hypothetical protein E4T39_05676 [Aureobasidium subglaciale]|nr:hypothetical protein E4T39_05676 [Aureobasidium subglaciale]
MAQTSTSQPNLWKPRYAAKAHQEKPQQPQQFARSRSLREPFDAAELTRKLENHRSELKLEKARRELANKKIEMAAASAKPVTAQKEASLAVPEEKSSSGVQRSKSVQAFKTSLVNEQPERRRSILHRSRRQELKEEVNTEPAKPFVPRVAARQFANTTTPMKEKNEGRAAPTTTSTHKVTESKPKEVKVDKHVLDWSEPAIHAKPASPPLPSTAEVPDAEVTQKRMQALHAFRDTSRSRPRPLSTALENMREWNVPETNIYSKAPKPIQEEPVAPVYIHASNRPALVLSDRHDWSQGSQCGDSARASMHIFRKKDSAGEEAELAGLKASMRPSKPRQKSHGDAPDRMVGDAVKVIRDERRRSILNIFKRH